MSGSDRRGAEAALGGEAGWPRARLDRDYTARATVSEAEFARIIGDYLSLSRPAATLPGARLGLVYDQKSGQRLDLFGAAPGQRRPLFLFIHGGYWRALSKEHSAFMAPMLAARGIATAVPDYDPAPGATLSEITRQMRAALAWLWHEAEGLGIDRQRIVIGGSSAGGHLCGTLLSEGWQRAAGLPDQPLRGAQPVSGLFDLAPIAASHVQDWMAFSPAEVRDLSPLRNLPAPGCRISLIRAQHEAAGFHRQTRAYLAALHGAGLGPVASRAIAGRNHFDVILDLCDPSSRLSRDLLRLFG